MSYIKKDLKLYPIRFGYYHIIPTFIDYIISYEANIYFVYLEYVLNNMTHYTYDMWSSIKYNQVVFPIIKLPTQFENYRQ